MEQIVLIGKDARMRASAAYLHQSGYAAEHFTSFQETQPQALQHASAVVLPIPAWSAMGAAWQTLRHLLPSECLLCGGGVDSLDWPWTLDFLTDEGFARANAIPTALARSFSVRGALGQ